MGPGSDGDTGFPSRPEQMASDFWARPPKTLACGLCIQPPLVTLANLPDQGWLPGYLYDLSYHCDLSWLCVLLPQDTTQCWAGTSAVTPQQGQGRAP